MANTGSIATLGIFSDPKVKEKAENLVKLIEELQLHLNRIETKLRSGQLTDGEVVYNQKLKERCVEYINLTNDALHRGIQRYVNLEQIQQAQLNAQGQGQMPSLSRAS